MIEKKNAQDVPMLTIDRDSSTVRPTTMIVVPSQLESRLPYFGFLAFANRAAARFHIDFDLTFHSR